MPLPRQPHPSQPAPARRGQPMGAANANKRITIPYPSAGSPVYKDPKPSSWVSYSGQDIRAYIQLYGDMVWLANLYTLSYSTFRDIIPVRGLGQAGPLGHARGHRTIAGSMVFTQFNKDALFDYISFMAHDRNASGWYPVWLDQIPPFNLIVLCSGEVTREIYAPEWRDIQRQSVKDSPSSRLIIYQVTLSGSGGTMSVDDMITEQICNWHSLGVAPLMDIADGAMAGSPQLTADNQSRLLREAKGYGQEPRPAEAPPEGNKTFQTTEKPNLEPPRRPNPQKTGGLPDLLQEAVKVGDLSKVDPNSDPVRNLREGAATHMKKAAWSANPGDSRKLMALGGDYNMVALDPSMLAAGVNGYTAAREAAGHGADAVNTAVGFLGKVRDNSGNPLDLYLSRYEK